MTMRLRGGGTPPAFIHIALGAIIARAVRVREGIVADEEGAVFTEARLLVASMDGWRGTGPQWGQLISEAIAAIPGFNQPTGAWPAWLPPAKALEIAASNHNYGKIFSRAMERSEDGMLDWKTPVQVAEALAREAFRARALQRCERAQSARAAAIADARRRAPPPGSSHPQSASASAPTQQESRHRLTSCKLKILWGNIGIIDIKPIDEEAAAADGRAEERLTAQELQVDIESTARWGPGTKYKDALRRLKADDVAGIFLSEVGYVPHDPLDAKQRLRVIVRIAEQLGYQTILSQASAADKNAGIIFIFKPTTLSVVDTEVEGGEGRLLMTRIRVTECVLHTEVWLAGVYGPQNNFKGPARITNNFKEATRVKLLAHHDLLVVGGDFNQRHPDDPRAATTARDAHLAQLVETCSLGRVGKLRDTYFYVAADADEARGIPRSVASTCIDHVLAGPSAMSMTTPTAATPPLGGKDTGHKVIGAAIITYRHQKARPAGQGSARVPRPADMPDGPSTQELREWSERNGGAPPPSLGWKLFDELAREMAEDHVGKEDASRGRKARPSTRLLAACAGTNAALQEAVDITKSFIGEIHHSDKVFLGETGTNPTSPSQIPQSLESRDLAPNRTAAEATADESDELDGGSRRKRPKKSEEGRRAKGAGKRRRSDLELAESKVTKWSTLLEKARARTCPPPGGGVPYAIRMTASHDKNFILDKELREFYEDVTLDDGPARRQTEQRLLDSRYAAASAALASMIEAQTWTSFKERMLEATKEGKHGVVKELYKAFSESAPQANRSKKAKGPVEARSKGIRSLTDHLAVSQAQETATRELTAALAHAESSAAGASALTHTQLNASLEAMGAQTRVTGELLKESTIPKEMAATLHPPPLRVGDELKEALARTGQSMFEEQTTSLRALGHLLERINIPRDKTYDSLGPVVLDGKRLDLGPEPGVDPTREEGWMVRERQREREYQEGTRAAAPARSARDTASSSALPATQRDWHTRTEPDPAPKRPAAPPGSRAAGAESEPPAKKQRGEGATSTPDLTGEDGRWLRECFAPERVQRVVRRFTKIKAVATSQFSAYLLKKSDALCELFAGLLLDAATTLDFPAPFFEWIAQLALKPGKKNHSEYKAYREIWIQEHLWSTILGCIRGTFDEAANRTRAWAQVGWATGYGYTEVLLGVGQLFDLAMATGQRRVLTFKDIRRFHPEIPRDGRFFLDCWMGTRPAAVRVIASVHTHATGRFKTAAGLTDKFDFNLGAGLGCLLAAVSSIHHTTVTYRLNECTTSGLNLLAPESYARSVLAAWYADDEAGLAELVRNSQSQLDGCLLSFKILRLTPGHDKGGEKTARQIHALTRSGWIMERLQKLQVALGKGGDDTLLAWAEIYKYLGKDLGVGRSHSTMEERATANIAALLHLLSRIAGGASSAEEVAEAIAAITRGVLDSAAAATPFREATLETLNAHARKTFYKLGHSLKHNYTLALQAPMKVGGGGIRPQQPLARAALAGNTIKVLRGRDGEGPRAAVEAGVRTTYTMLGSDTMHHLGPILDFNPSTKAMTCLDETVILENVLKSLSCAKLRLRRADATSSSSMASGADSLTRHRGHELRDADGPRLDDLPGVQVSRALRARHVQTLGDVHEGGGKLILEDTFKRAFGEPGNEVLKADLEELRDLKRSIEGCPRAVEWLEEKRREGTPRSAEIDYAIRTADLKRRRAAKELPIERLGWTRTRETDDAEVIETYLQGARNRECLELTLPELQDLARSVGVTGAASSEEESMAALDALLQDAKHRVEPRSFNHYIDLKFGSKEKGDAFRARTNGHPLDPDTGDALVEATDLFIDEYAPRKRHNMPLEVNLKENREDIERCSWSVPKHQTYFPTNGIKEKARASLDQRASDVLRGLKPIAVSPQEAMAAFPEVDWAHAHERPPGCFLVGQTGAFDIPAAAMARPELRPFFRHADLESRLTRFEGAAEEGTLFARMPRSEIKLINNKATLDTILQVARLSLALRARDAGENAHYPLHVMVGCGDASRKELPLGDSNIGAGVWWGEQPTDSLLPVCVASGVTGDAEVADGELIAAWLNSKKAEAIHDMGYRVIAIYTGDCKAPLEDQARIFEAGSMRNTWPVNMAIIHEDLARTRAKIESRGGHDVHMREPAHTGRIGNHNADAIAKGAAESLPMALAIAKSLTYLPTLEAQVRGTADAPIDWSPMAAGGAKITRTMRARLMDYYDELSVTTGRRPIFEEEVGRCRRNFLQLRQQALRNFLEDEEPPLDDDETRQAITDLETRTPWAADATSVFDITDQRWRAYPSLAYGLFKFQTGYIEMEHWPEVVLYAACGGGGSGGYLNQLTHAGVRMALKCSQDLFMKKEEATDEEPGRCPFCRNNSKRARSDFWHYAIECEAGIDTSMLQELTAHILKFLEILLPLDLSATPPRDGLVNELMMTLMYLNSRATSNYGRAAEPELVTLVMGHAASSILAGIWPLPSEYYFNEDLKKEPTMKSRKVELIKAAKSCVDGIADAIMLPINSILEDGHARPHKRSASLRALVVERREHEQEEQLVTEATTAAEKNRIALLPFAERETAEAEARAGRDSARADRWRKWDDKKAAQKAKETGRKGHRAVEITSRLGPIALRRIALPANAPPPWCMTSTDPPSLPAEPQLADPDDLDWQTSFGVINALNAGTRNRSKRRHSEANRLATRRIEARHEASNSNADPGPS